MDSTCFFGAANEQVETKLFSGFERGSISQTCNLRIDFIWWGLGFFLRQFYGNNCFQLHILRFSSFPLINFWQSCYIFLVNFEEWGGHFMYYFFWFSKNVSVDLIYSTMYSMGGGMGFVVSKINLKITKPCLDFIWKRIVLLIVNKLTWKLKW